MEIYENSVHIKSISDWGKIKGNKDDPYYVAERTRIEEAWIYNPEYGDHKLCNNCGHEYGRHFDSWENDASCGCKYCGCRKFVALNN